MRYLKRKVVLKPLSDEENNDTISEDQPDKPISKQTIQNFKESKVEKEVTTLYETKKAFTSSKNIVKNYGRALTNFALSKTAIPYLLPFLQKEKIELKEFREFISSRKDKINCIVKLRELLLVKKEDTEKIASIRRIFQKISEIFIKFFSVNWIYSSSKLYDKMTHIKCRFKLLRRIRDPENFTYFETVL